MPSGVYNQFKTEIMNKVIDLEADDIKVALLDTNHSFDQTHTGWTPRATNELSATGGYATGGESLTARWSRRSPRMASTPQPMCRGLVPHFRRFTP